MIIESDGNGGWLVERNNRYIHLTEEWLAEMYRHQVKPYGNNPAYNRLVHAFRTSSDPNVIAERLEAFYGNRQKPARGGRSNASPIQEFAKRRRNERANR